MTKFRIVAGLLGLLLLLGFLLPPAIKLKELSLAAVMLIGVVMAAYEFYENLRQRDEHK